MPTSSLAKLDPNEATRLVGHIALTDISIVRTVGELLAIPNSGAHLSYEVLPIAVHWFRTEPDVVIAVFTCEVKTSYSPGNAKDKTTMARFELGLQATYKIVKQPESVENSLVAQYIGVVGFMHMWPFLRVEVQQLTAKLKLPALTLPVKVSGQAPDLVLISAQPTSRDEDDVKPTASPTPSRSRAPKAKRRSAKK